MRVRKEDAMREWMRDRSLGIFFTSLFLVSWVAQLGVDATATFWSADFWVTFWQSTLANWQSEFLQLATFTIAAAYFVYKGSSESPDGDERLEAKVDALLEERGIEPTNVEKKLAPKYQTTR
jgi:hypothetical protein